MCAERDKETRDSEQINVYAHISESQCVILDFKKE